jgi:hypothetical protein
MIRSEYAMVYYDRTLQIARVLLWQSGAWLGDGSNHALPRSGLPFNLRFVNKRFSESRENDRDLPEGRRITLSVEREQIAIRLYSNTVIRQVRFDAADAWNATIHFSPWP